MIDKWWEILNIDTFDSPAMVVYPDRIQANIKEMLHLIGDVKRLRPHIKTHKLKEVIEMQQAVGINKFKASTIAEAELLGETNAEDVLIAYQLVGPKIKRLKSLIQKYPESRFSCLVDDRSVAKEMSEIFSSDDNILDVFLDYNNGCFRTGIQYDEGAFELYKLCHSLPGLNMRGLHAYDGHVKSSEYQLRKEQSDLGFDAVLALKNDINTQWNLEPEIVMGGSPTFGIHANRPYVDCSPGTCLFWDWGYAENYPELNFKFAALVVSRVISKPGSNRLCLDLGHKAVAADKPLPRVYFLNLPETQVLNHSEEHMVVEVVDNSKYEIGEVFYGVPTHICPTTALHQYVGVVKDKMIVDHWEVAARNRKITI